MENEVFSELKITVTFFALKLFCIGLLTKINKFVCSRFGSLNFRYIKYFTFENKYKLKLSCLKMFFFLKLRKSKYIS